MDIAQITGSGSKVAEASSSKKGDSTLAIADFQEFLNLFVTQLRYQDPLSPMAGEEFLAQTAQFSSVEQLVNLNSKVSASTDAALLSSKSTAAALIGQTVHAKTFDVDGNEIGLSGRVVQVDFAGKGGLLLGLEDGSTISFSDVVAVGDKAVVETVGGSIDAASDHGADETADI